MSDPTVNRYFAALDFTHTQREYLWRLAEEIEVKYGDFVSRRSKFPTLHVTIGVVEDGNNQEVDLESMKRTVEKTLIDVGVGEILLSNIGRFDDGAVYMEMEDVDGVLGKLRQSLRTWAASHGMTMLDQSVFHVTFFRSNTLTDPVLMCERFRRKPLEIRVKYQTLDEEQEYLSRLYVHKIRSRVTAESGVGAAGDAQEASVQYIGGVE